MSQDKKRKCKAGEVYACYITELKKYCAYQILNTERASALYVALDYLDIAIPTSDMLESMRPYRMNRYFYSNEIDESWVDNTSLPEQYVYVGSCELKSNPNNSNYSSGKWPLGENYIYEESWNSIDKNITSAFKENIINHESIILGSKEFFRSEKVLDNNLFDCMSNCEESGLFPCLIQAEIKGYKPLLVEILANKPLIYELVLEKPEAGIIDLRKTHLTRLEIDVTGVKKLILPFSITYLHLYGDASEDLIIENRHCDSEFTLSVDMKNMLLNRFCLDQNLVTYLTLRNAKEVDLAYVAECFPKLTGMYINGNPGLLKKLYGLKKLSQINGIYITDMFGYSAEDLMILEELPHLRVVDFESIPKDAGTYLKKHWKGRVEEFRVTCLRDDNWMKENFENPLRHWDGSEFVPKRAYNAAIKCFKETKKKFQVAESRDDIIEAVMQYTLTFNQLNSKYDEFIESEEREDIFIAMEKLYETCIICKGYNKAAGKHATITLQEIWDIIDENRDLW